MEILTNKNEIIKQIDTFFDEMIKTKNIRIIDLMANIKTKMLEIGAKLAESWFIQNIGNGYQGCKIRKNINGIEEELRFTNYLEKTYLSSLGEVRLKRAYYQNKHINIFPIEEEHEWLKNEFLPDIKELSCYVSMLEPYDMASEMLRKVGGIKISSASLQKITKNIGEKLVQKENESIKSQNNKYPKNVKNIDLLAISCDGACINTENGWKEVKNGAVYQIKKNKDDKLMSYNKTYVSRIENCEIFGKRLYGEALRRHIGYAKEIVTIGDGAKWIWELFGNYYPRAVQIVDWYHATEHLWKIIEFMYGNRDSEIGKEFEKKCEDILYNGLILLLENTIIDKMNELGIKENSERYKNIIKGINYFKTNEKRMKYSDFEKKCYPIGSGVIEGACKHLVQIRMKRNGMKWSTEGAHDVLQLRCLYLSNRWREVENAIESAA